MAVVDSASLQEHLPAFSRISRAARPVWILIGFGCLLYALIFSYLLLLSFLMSLVGLAWPGQAPDWLRPPLFPVNWAVSHLVIIGALALILAWLWMRDWIRSLAIVTALLNLIVLAGFASVWYAFFRPSVYFNVQEQFIPSQMLNLMSYLAMFGMATAAICSIWHVACRNRTAAWIFAGSPVFLFGIFIVVASPGYALEALRHFGSIIREFCSVFPIFAFCIALAACFVLRHFYSLLLRSREDDAQRVTPWLLGLIANVAFFLLMVAAATSVTPLLIEIPDGPPDMRWRDRLIMVMVSVDALLAITAALTLYLQLNRKDGDKFSPP